MAKYQVTVAGQSFEIEAPDDASASAAVQQLVGQVQQQPAAQQPVQPGDWAELGRRVGAREQAMTDMGPTPPDWIEAARLEEAKRQGQMYGATRGGLEAGARKMVDTFGGGLPNYLEAATSGWDSGLSMAERHEAIKAADYARSEANPGASVAGDLGAIGVQVATLPASMGKNAAQRIASGVGISAGLSGAGEGVRTRGDAEQALYAMGTGAGFGLLGGSAAEAAAPLVRRGGEYLSQRAAKFSGPAEDQAAARILAAAERSGLTPEAAQEAMARLGPEAMVADVMGASGGRMARAVSNTNPDAQQLIAESLARRAAGGPERLAGAAYEAGGVPFGSTVSGLSDDIYKAAQPEVSRLYAAARAEGADLPAEPFRELMQSPLVRDAVDRAIKETKNRVIAFGEGQNSALGVMNAAKQHLDATAEAAARAGDNSTASVARELARKLRTTVDEYSGSYAPARAASQRIYQEQEALQAGADAARKANVGTPQALAQIPADMQERVAQGYASDIANSLLSKRGTPGLTDAFFGSPNQQAAMKAALGPRAAKLADQVEAERVFARTERAQKGSDTARNIADLGLIPAAAGVGYLGGYDPVQALGWSSMLVAGRRGVNKLLDARRAGTEEKVALEIAKKLVKQNLPDMPKRATEGWEKDIAKSLIQGSRAAVAPVSSYLVQE